MTKSPTTIYNSNHHAPQTQNFSAMFPILVLSLCAAFLFYKYIIQNFPSIISQELMEDFNLQGLGLGMLSAGYFWTYLLVPLIVGIILDRYGTRWITGGAIFCCALSLFWFSQVNTLNLAILTRAFMGVGVSFATITYMKLAAIWFSPKKYALLIGLLVSAAMAGAICGQMPLAWLVKLVGWRNALYDIGLLGFGLAIIFLLVVRESPFSSSPSIISMKTNTISRSELLQVFKSKQNWLLMLYSGLSFSPVVIFCGLWGNPFLQIAFQLSPIHAASLISLVFIGLGLGSPLFGFLSSRFSNRRQLMIYSTLFSSLALSLILYCQAMPIWLLSFWLFIFGFSLGPFSFVFVIGKELNPLHLAGTVIAMINASEAFLDAITEPLVGKILDLLAETKIIGTLSFSLHSYHIALAILPLYQIISSALLLGVQDSQKHE